MLKALFGASAPATQPQNQQNQQQTPAPAPAPAPAEPQFALDNFKELFTPSKAPEDSNKEPTSAQSFYPDFLSPEFQKNLEPIKPADSIPSEVFAQLIAGNPKPFQESLNKIVQHTILYTFAGLGKLTAEGVERRLNSINNELTKLVKSTNVDIALSQHPMLSHPSVKPLRDALASSLAEKHPAATPQQIQASVDEYLKAFVADFAKMSAPPPPSNKDKQLEDWEKFFN